MNNKNDTIIISDIHLGLTGSDVESLLDLISNTKFKRLILLGDIFQSTNIKRLHRKEWKFLGKLRKFTDPTKYNMEIIWVEGNHDYELLDVVSALTGIEV